MPSIKRLDTRDTGFATELERLLAWESGEEAGVRDAVREILDAVKAEGDAAVLRYTERFDRLERDSVAGLEVPQQRLQAALEAIPAAQREALETAAERIGEYARHQSMQDWQFTDADGTVLGQRVTPLDSVGLYVPGGKAAYPSSVLMNAVPARVAGVGQLIMVVPAPDGELNDLVLAAAAVAGVDRVFTVGGAQAVGALAYGTATIPAVDKIVGPGNIFVAAAKREVFGTVGIDMIAGPSEILVVCDGETDPEWIAADLFSQAEHDEQAQSILVSWDHAFLDRVNEAMDRLLEEMPRADIIRTSLQNRGALIAARDLDDAVAVANRVAPEHLELSLADPQAALDAGLRHAGAVFMGRHTSEALGDYCAGPNHVLPTSRTARFSSPLGVYDFQKRSSIIQCSPEGAARLGRTAAELAHGEGLTAHARSAELRRES
ncbi:MULTISPECIES: histidinol dehydrogenase [Thioalkalivibrio]|uniref:Histidinol dehydrogenase n=1 Tax=Thioalkalivibrio halophilus TaxID=252474 RepID=A0A1V2ZVV8_9GAMM|nr:MULTISPECIES: histidinol dehydrogenase [Thioalkalivibrio]OOC09196.1 histidinol dehydrogenase [Thioalkalivibrio halophilus]PYG03122.1 histidinol dehydrogenase [Thioalkalivibrio sp. ALE21]